MSKVKEISEEQFKVLSELGITVCWDYEPFFPERHIELNLKEQARYPGLWCYSLFFYLEYKKNTSNKREEYKFYTLVEEEDTPCATVS